MHQTDQQHPTLQQLAAFGLGKLEDEQVRVIEEHLEQCDQCAMAAKDLPDDSLIDLLRGTTDPDQGPTVLFDPAESIPPTVLPPGEQATLMPGRSDTDLSTNRLNAKRIDELDVPPPLVGHDRYAIQGRLGKGGMGSVFKAQHRIMNRPVALKVINPQLLSHPGAIKRFHREIQAASRLSHPNIVTAYDADHAGDSHFFVMEFVDGVDLDQVVKQRGPLPVTEACKFIRQAALGLQHAHEQGMIHRDIKPHNLMLAASGDVKILDFGLANFASEMAAEEVEETHPGQQAQAAQVLHQLTQMGTMMGTPDYIAPEQAKDAHAADIRADIYSLGCTLYTLLTGQTPFSDGSVLDKIQAHANQDAPPPSDFRDDVPAEVEAIVKKMMAKDPADRYQTPQEVAEALKPHCMSSTQPVQTHRRPRVWVAVACLLAAAIGFAVYYIQTNNGVVRVEVNDESLLVKLNGETITMKDGEKELTIRPGEQTLVVEREDGFKFETDKFQLRRGDVIALKVELLPGQVVVQKDGERFGAKPLLNSDSNPSRNTLLSQLETLANAAVEESDDDKLATWMEMNSSLLLSPNDPATRAVLKLLGGLSQADHERLLKDGYLKWKYSQLDPTRQAEFKDAVSLRMFPQPAAIVMNAETIDSIVTNILKNEVGFYVTEIPDSDEAMIGWFPVSTPIPLFGSTTGLDEKHGAKLLQFQRDRAQEVLKLPKSPLPNRSQSKLDVAANEVRVTYDERNGNPLLKIDGKAIGQVEDALTQLRTKFKENPELVVVLDIGPGLDPESVRDTMVADRVAKMLAATGASVKLSGKLEKATQGQELREERRKAFQQIGIALHSYHDAHKQFPPSPGGNNPGDRFNEQGRPHLSWRVHLLPYLEDGDQLYRRFRLHEPWDSEHNKTLLDKMPDVFKTTDDPTKTSLLAVVGDGTAYEGKVGFTIDEIVKRDGAADTAYIVDAGPEKAVNWTKPEDLPFDKADPIRAFGTSEFGDIFLALMCDGSVKSIPYDTAPEQLRNLFLRNDGNPLDLNKKRTTPLTDPSSAKNGLTSLGRLAGHASVITQVTFSPDGLLAASLTGNTPSDGSVRIWNVATKREISLVKYLSTSKPAAMAFSPDSKQILIGGDDHKVNLWDIQTHKVVKTFPTQPGRIKEVLFTPDGKSVITSSLRLPSEPLERPGNGAVRIWPLDELNNSRLLYEPDQKGGTSRMAISADGSRLAIGYGDPIGKTIVLNLVTGEKMREWASRHAGELKFLPDGRRLISTGALTQFSRAILWDSETGQRIRNYPYGDQPTKGLALTPDGRYVIVSDNTPALTIWNVETADMIAKILTPEITIDLDVSPDGKTLLSAGGAIESDGDYAQGKDLDLQLWQLPESVWPPGDDSSLESTRILPGDGNTVEALVYLPDGKRVVSGSKGKQLVVWDVITGKRLQTLPWDQPIRRILVLPDGRVVTGGDAGGVRIWNLDEAQKSVDLPNQGQIVFGLDFSPESKLLLTAAHNRVCLWDLESLKELRSVPANCRGAGFINQGKQIVHLDHSRVVIRDVETLEIDRTLAEVSSGRNLLELAVSKDAKYVAFGDIEIFIHELSTDREVARIPISPTTLLRSLRFLPEGHMLIAGDDSPLIRLIDAASGELVITHRLASHSALCLAVSPDGSTLASSGGTWKDSAGQYRDDSDKAIYLWRLPERRRR